MPRPFLPSLVSALLLLVAGSARGGNQEAVFLGNEAALSGGAVVAWVDDGGAAWYNPAGLASIERTSVDLSASAFVIRYYVLPDAARTQLPTGTEAEDASFTELVSVPSALTVVRKLADGITGALAVYVPMQEDLLVEAAYFSDAALPYRYRWSLAASRSTSRYYAGPALGFRVAPTVHMGLSTFLTYEAQSTTRDFSSSLEAPGSGEVERAIITVDRRLERRQFGAAWVLGWRWEPTEAWSAGLVLRGPLMHVAGDDDIDLGNTETRIHATDPPVARADYRHTSDQPGIMEVMEPGRITLGVARHFGAGRLSLEGGWQSAASGGGRVRKPVWNVRAGGTVSVTDELTLGGGLFTDRSPDPPPSALGLTQVDFYGGSFGLQFRSPYDVYIDEEIVGLEFSTTLALRYAIGIGEIGSLLFDPLDVPRDQVADVTIHELSFHVGSALDF